MADPRPHVLVIRSDEHDRRVTGCSGHPQVQPPALDAMAADGSLFENAYCNSPICTPSRNSLLTGRYCHEIEASDLHAPLRADAPT